MKCFINKIVLRKFYKERVSFYVMSEILFKIHDSYRWVVAVCDKDIYGTPTYSFLDKAYILIDGNPTTEILVKIKPKNPKQNLEKLGREFNNELINYAFYNSQSLRNQQIKEAIIRSAFLTHREGENGNKNK